MLYHWALGQNKTRAGTAQGEVHVPAVAERGVYRDTKGTGLRRVMTAWVIGAFLGCWWSFRMQQVISR